MYVLILRANNGETVTLDYKTHAEALRMRQAFMNTGDYYDADIKLKGANHAADD